MTDAELNALVARLDDMSDLSRDHAAGLLDLGHKVAVNQAIAAITTLRAQLAEAQTKNEKLGREVNVARYGQPDFAWSIHKEALAAETARADRAEAALAAQIEVDAGMIERIVTEARQEVGSIKLSKVDAAVVEMLSGIAKAIRNQPHDRTALDRMLAEAREKALREAAGACDWGDIYGDNAVRVILALIEAHNAR